MGRILILDGGLGTQVQCAGFGGGCTDHLSVTHGDVIAKIHRDYLEAGADIISTNSFNANRFSLVEYGLQDCVYDINFAAARVARVEADKFNALVAGSVGVGSKSLSMSDDMDHTEHRGVSFDELAEAFAEQLRGLIDGGVDMILLETVYDTLNGKAVIFALRNILNKRDFPLMISGTITDASGRILSGQTVDAFYYSIEHAKPISVGLNCAFGAKQMKQYVERLREIASCKVSAHPNAGLPNLLGGYDETPQEMAQIVDGYLSEGLVDIIGGCCGTTPEYIAELKKIRDNYSAKPLAEPINSLVLSGLEPLIFDKTKNFINIGERTNVAGSAKFARLIRDGKYGEALAVAREQIAGGAQVIDICMDDAMIDGVVAMTTFLNLLASEPDICKVPVMIDSSHWEVIEAGLKCVQGRSIVNSISLKEGETDFLRKARLVDDLGGAMVVMLFDENGQADTYERKIEVAGRAYKLLAENGISGNKIVFDPNILSIATGIKAHDRYGVDFIRAVEWIKANCAGVSICGGVSNLSFSFRGNNAVREAMHTVFLYHAIAAGMDSGIVNPSLLQIYDNIDPVLREAVEDVVLCRDDNATERLIELASGISSSKSEVQSVVEEPKSATQRVQMALISGKGATIASDTVECYNEMGSALSVINDILMVAMGRVGELFGCGKMFLPQVVKSARMMKEAVDALKPYLVEVEGEENGKKRVVVATVKGDVHDIGKNIVALVLRCNNYEVVDLGVMVDSEKIVEAAQNADVVVLSGLITPSLDQMCIVAKKLQAQGLNVPLAIGGATTSPVHTAVKIAPLYDGVVAHSFDASGCANLLHRMFNDAKFIQDNITKQEILRNNQTSQVVNIESLSDARKKAPKQL